MSAAGTAKKECQLAADESLLRAQLLEVLPSAIERGSDLFTNQRFNPFGLLAANIGPFPQALLEAAEACISLREGLRLPVAGSVGQLFVSACEERASSDPHSHGPRRLAERLYASLTSDI